MRSREPTLVRSASNDSMSDIACRDNAEKLMALTREVSGLKLAESQLVAAVAAANGNADAARARVQHLEAELATCRKQRGNFAHAAESWTGHTVAELHAAAAAQDSELHKARSDLLEARQACDAKAQQLAQAEEAMEATKREAQVKADSAGTALAAQREQLEAEAAAERAVLTGLLEQARERVDELQRRLQEEVRTIDKYAQCMPGFSTCSNRLQRLRNMHT